MATLILYLLHKHKLNCYFKGSNPKWLDHWDRLGPLGGIEYRENAYISIAKCYGVLWLVELTMWVTLLPEIA